MVDAAKEIEAQRDGPLIRKTALVFFDFKSQPVRVFAGFGRLRARGYEWQGLGRLGQLTYSGAGLAGIVEEMTFSLAASEEMLTFADEDADNDETIGRDVEVWIQSFDVVPERDWQLLGDPLLYFWGKMGPIAIDRQVAEDDGQVIRTIEVTAQNAMLNFARPPHSFFSDTDQKARSSDGADNICLRMPEFVDGSVLWPRF